MHGRGVAPWRRSPARRAVHVGGDPSNGGGRGRPGSDGRWTAGRGGASTCHTRRVAVEQMRRRRRRLACVHNGNGALIGRTAVPEPAGRTPNGRSPLFHCPSPHSCRGASSTSTLAPAVGVGASEGGRPPENFVSHMYKYAVLGTKPTYNRYIITKFSSPRLNYIHQKIHLGRQWGADKEL